MGSSLQGRYALVAALALLGLTPYVVLSTALFPLEDVLVRASSRRRAPGSPRRGRTMSAGFFTVLP